MPTTDILIRSYSRDFPWLHYALRSIQKFTTGFRQVVIVIPDTDDLLGLTVEKVVKVKDPEGVSGYLFQQIVKTNADRYTDADFILVTDSDTLFTEPVAPESFMREGKPIWYMTPFKNLEGSDCHKAWFPVLTEFFGEEPEFEMMRRQPFMFPREVLEGLRSYCYDHHGITLENYVSRKGTFSEWNVLGTYCWLHHREKFSWINTDEECPPAKCRQFWSHGTMSESFDEINRILA